MNLLLDMNLTPALCQSLGKEGWNAIHWSSVGDPRAEDEIIMEWAKVHGYTVVTNDLDFGAILAVTRASGPSVVQVRIEDLRPGKLAPLLIQVLRNYESAIATGALIVVDVANSRVRMLPFG